MSKRSHETDDGEEPTAKRARFEDPPEIQSARVAVGRRAILWRIAGMIEAGDARGLRYISERRLVDICTPHPNPHADVRIGWKTLFDESRLLSHQEVGAALLDAEWYSAYVVDGYPKAQRVISFFSKPGVPVTRSSRTVTASRAARIMRRMTRESEIFIITHGHVHLGYLGRQVKFYAIDVLFYALNHPRFYRIDPSAWDSVYKIGDSIEIHENGWRSDDEARVTRAQLLLGFVKWYGALYVPQVFRGQMLRCETLADISPVFLRDDSLYQLREELRECIALALVSDDGNDWWMHDPAVWQEPWRIMEVNETLITRAISKMQRAWKNSIDYTHFTLRPEWDAERVRFELSTRARDPKTLCAILNGAFRCVYGGSPGQDGGSLMRGMLDQVAPHLTCDSDLRLILAVMALSMQVQYPLMIGSQLGYLLETWLLSPQSEYVRQTRYYKHVFLPFHTSHTCKTFSAMRLAARGGPSVGVQTPRLRIDAPERVADALARYYKRYPDKWRALCIFATGAPLLTPRTHVHIRLGARLCLPDAGEPLVRASACTYDVHIETSGERDAVESVCARNCVCAARAIRALDAAAALPGYDKP